MKPFDYAVAESLEGALAGAAQGWKPKAGGIDLLDLLKERIEPADKLVSLHGLSGEMRGLRWGADGSLEIGPLTTLRELERDANLRERFPALAYAAGDAATPQIRAVATAGGNLMQRPRCWYYRHDEFPCLKKGGSTCFAVDGEHQFHALFGGGPCHIVHPSNLAPVLVAVGAKLTLAKSDSSRLVDAEEFFALPSARLMHENTAEDGEVLTKITIPSVPKQSAYVEVRQKQSFDWPLAACAAVQTALGWRIVLGAVAPVPWRSPAAEKAAGTGAVTHELAASVGQASLEGATPLPRAAWRLPLVAAVVRRALLTASGMAIDPEEGTD